MEVADVGGSSYPQGWEQREELELLKLGACRRVPVAVTLRPLRSRHYLAGTGVSQSGGRVPGDWHREGVIEWLGGQGEEAGVREVFPSPRWYTHKPLADRSQQEGASLTFLQPCSLPLPTP